MKLSYHAQMSAMAMLLSSMPQLKSEIQYSEKYELNQTKCKHKPTKAEKKRERRIRTLNKLISQDPKPCEPLSPAPISKPPEASQ